MMEQIFLGFARTRLFPIGICIFEAYFSRSSIWPNEVSGFQASGLRALPLKPLIDLDKSPFLIDPE